MWTQHQQQKTFTSSPSLLRAGFWGVFGLPFLGGGLMMTAAAFTKGIGAIFGGAMFLGGGVYLERTAYNALRQWRAFGTSHLRLKTAPVPLGTTLRARLRVPVSAHDQPPSGFQARVICTQGAADDKEQVWQDSTSVRGQPGVDKTVLSVSLDLPAQPLSPSRRRMAEATPWSSERHATERLDWTLKVTASFEDKPDYVASFDIPVSVPDDFDERADKPAKEDPAATDAPTG